MPIIFICNRRSIKQITQKCSEEKIGLFFRRGAVPRGLARRKKKEKKEAKARAEKGTNENSSSIRGSTIHSALGVARSARYRPPPPFRRSRPVARQEPAKSAAFHTLPYGLSFRILLAQRRRSDPPNNTALRVFSIVAGAVRLANGSNLASENVSINVRSATRSWHV